MWTYNGARYLAEQLESIARQTRPPDELVVSDDASSDETVRIVERYARRFRFPVRIAVNPVNVGGMANYGNALSLCRGDVIVPVGQDDIQYPDKLSSIEAAFQARPEIGLCFSDAELIDEDSRPIGQTLWQRIRFSTRERRNAVRGDLMTVLVRHNVVSGPASAFRSEYRDLILPIPADWWEDYWGAIIISSLSSAAMIPRCLVKYRLHRDQQLGLPEGPFLYNHIYAGWLVDFWSDARALLRQRLSVEQSRLAFGYIDDMIEHCRMRATLPHEKLHRIPLVMQDVLNGRYSRYSYGLGSALSDVTYPSRTLGLVRRLLTGSAQLRPISRRLYGSSGSNS
jgi:glycosyltransferase involved in cell wall biosynthesis